MDRLKTICSKLSPTECRLILNSSSAVCDADIRSMIRMALSDQIGLSG
jgi:hypothetical protein